MYYIYVDEAGTSAKEPVTVVVGVIINADRHWRAASRMLQDTIQSLVPEPLRPGFIFHAKDVWGGYRRYDSIWSRERRCDLIEAVASIPRRLHAAISIGIVRRDSEIALDGMKRHDAHHMWAFWRCIARSNKYVRDWAEQYEVATLIAEDVHDKRRFLRATLKIPVSDLPLVPPYILPTEKEKRTGVVRQTNTGQIDRIIDTVHFVSKGDAPLMQLADACAFSFRRFFAEQDFGERMVRTMLGNDLNRSDWSGETSDAYFPFNRGPSGR